MAELHRAGAAINRLPILFYCLIDCCNANNKRKYTIIIFFIVEAGSSVFWTFFDENCTDLCRDTRRDTSVLARMENIDDDCKLNDIIFVKVNLNFIVTELEHFCMPTPPTLKNKRRRKKL